MLSFLYTSLLVLIIAGSSWVAFGTVGLFLSALIGILAVLLNRTQSIATAILYFMAVLFGLFCLALFLPAVSAAREAACRMQCCNQLKQIGLALHDYHQAYECFPPAFLANQDGKPMHSWRVLILPFMELQKLYDKYRFDEPWDGPNNRKLLDLDECPRVYECPSYEKVQGDHTSYTNYVAVLGPNAAWQGEKPRSMHDVLLRGKDTATVLVVESISTRIPWTEPRDMTLDINHVVDPTNAQVIVSSRHKTEMNDYFHRHTPITYAVMVNGFVQAIPAGIRGNSPLLHIGGYTDRSLRIFWDARINWSHCIGLLDWILSVGLLLHYAVRSRKRRERQAEAI